MQWLKNQYSASENWSSGGHKSPVVCFAMVSPMSDSHIFFLQKNRSDEDPAVNVRVHRPAAWSLPSTYLHRGHLLSSFLLPLPHPAWFFLLLLRLPPLPWKVLSWTHPWLKSFFTQLWRKKNKRKEKKKDSTLPVRFFSAFYPRMGGKIQSNWKGWQLLKNYIIYTHILCSFHPHLY